MKKSSIKLLEIKTTISEIKNILNRIKGRLDIAGENTTNLKTTVQTLKHIQF